MTALEGKALLDHGKAIANRYARCVGADVAEELRAESVLRALRSPPPDGRLRPWLERIYRNLLVDCWRRGRPPTVDLALVPGLASTGTPEEAVLGRERRRQVRASLAGLPREARRALLARYYGQLDDEVAATRFGIAAVTIRTRIHRALARLRLRLYDLRAVCPPFLGKLGAQAIAVGMAPVMVTALVVAGASPPAPAPQEAAPAAIAVQPFALVRTPAAAAEWPSPAREPVRVAKRTVVPAHPSPGPARVAALDLPDDDEPSTGKILYPEAIDVFVEPAPTVVPCMVEPPASFLARIESMVEDLP
jgi:RNA polymerase sigma factor (sigma-70 family)